MNDWINNCGNWFSFLGFFLTILTFLVVLLNRSIIKKLNKKNFRINRLPENLEELKEISKNITNYLSQFEENIKAIKIEMVKISPILKSIKKSLLKGENEYLLSLQESLKDIDYWVISGERIAWYRKILGKEKNFTEQMADEVDIRLNRLITDIDTIGKDTQKDLL